jgi:hypothetical protein
MTTMNRAAAALLLVLMACGPVRAAGPQASPPLYDATAAPLDDLSRDLLASSGYEVRDDGKVWDKIADAPVTVDAMPELLSRLAGARRLKALLQLNIIFNRYDSDRHLSDDDREAVRGLVRGAWSVFGFDTRRDYRSYFTPQELEALDKIPPYQSPGVADMKDPESAPVTAVPVSAAPPAVSSAALTAAPPAVSSAAAAAVAAPAAAGAAVGAAVTEAAPAAAAGVGADGAAALAPLMAPPSLHRASPFAAAAPPSSAAPRAVPVAAVKFLPFTVPSGSTSTAVSPKAPDATVGEFKAWTPPTVSTSAAAAARAVTVSSAAPAAAAPVAKAAPPPLPPPPAKPLYFAAVSADEYQKFVADGPYSTESKEILKLIGQRAPDFCLPLLRRTVGNTVPQIVVDGRRTGSALRAAVVRDASDPDQPPIIALSPGPVLFEHRPGLFSSREIYVLPEAPDAWAELGIPAPPLIALSAEPPALAQQPGPWGPTRVYKDGSRRGTYSPQEQAGELLEQLLLIGLRRENFATSDYAARRWARTAKLLFWSRVNDDFGDAFLDPDRRAEFEAWLDHPGELDDVTSAVWASARGAVFDPRLGPPADERVFEEKARSSCVRTAIQDALVAVSRRRARSVGLLEQLIDADLVDPDVAKGTAKKAWIAEFQARRALTEHPPACPAFDPWRPEGLRKSALLLAEAARAESALRERRAESGGSRASR